MFVDVWLDQTLSDRTVLEGQKRIIVRTPLPYTSKEDFIYYLSFLQQNSYELKHQ